jgi:hypothetical protein
MKIQQAYLPVLIASALALAVPGAGLAAAPGHTSFTAQLQPMNTGVTKTSTAGTAHFRLDGDRVSIEVKVHGAPPDTVHWQHFHGFTTGVAASCPGADADANGDGIVDLIETGKAAGTTMVPLDSQPAAMDVAHGTYPKADAKGDYSYHATVSLKTLDAALAKAFPGQKLDLAKRVVFIHGVPDDTTLPSTVASLGPIPAQVTLPIACGKIEPATGGAAH